MRPSAYGIADRYRIVALSYEIGVRAAARRFGVWSSCVRYWREGSALHHVLAPGLPDLMRGVVAHGGR